MTAQATPLSPSHPSMVGRHTTRNGHAANTNYDSLSLYAKACARQSGLQLKVLGEAGFKYLSGAVETWRAGGTDNDAVGLSPRGACAASTKRSPQCRNAFPDVSEFRFQCGDDVSEVKRCFGIEKSRIWPSKCQCYSYHQAVTAPQVVLVKLYVAQGLDNACNMSSTLR